MIREDLFGTCLLSMALAVTIVGCGGGGAGGKKGGSTNGGSGGSVSTTERNAAIQATESECRELTKQGLSPDAFDEALKGFMAASGAYTQVGVDTESRTVWGLFKDGRMHMIANNRNPDKAGAASPELATRAISGGAAAYLPASKQARLIHSFGENFEGQHPIDEMSGWLKAAGYDVVSTASEGDASLAELRKVSGDGFFYINTHGGSIDLPAQGVPTYALDSSTLKTLSSDDEPAIKDDMANGRLVYFTAHNGGTFLGVFDDWDTRYAVTDAFVSKYWSFAKNSVVYLNACSSARTNKVGYATAMIAALHKKGAGVVLGWTNTLSAEYAFNSSRYFVDRLLGGNRYEPESTPQRAFSWSEVMTDMANKGLAYDLGTKAGLVALAQPGGPTPQLLNPSIERMLVDETQDLLLLYGSFGDKPGTARINGLDVDVVSWSPSQVGLRLPETGDRSHGPVQVLVDGHPSNLRNLTEWSFDVGLRYKDDSLNGPLVSGPVHLHYRADVGLFRLHPGEDPQSRTVYLWPARDSVANLTASGTDTVADVSTTWSGSNIYPAGGFSGTSLPNISLISRLAIDSRTKTGRLAIQFGALPGYGQFTSTQTSPTGTTSDKFVVNTEDLDGDYDFLHMLDPDAIPMTIQALKVEFASDWSLKARPFSDPDTGITLTVPSASATWAPDATTAR